MKEGLYFTYDGTRSDHMGLMNCKVNDTGLFNEPFLSEREILEYEVRGNDTPYFQGVKRRPLLFTVQFVFEDTYNEEKIRRVAKWLSPSFYKPFYTSDNPSRIFYCMPIEEPRLIHNGLKQGYLELTMRCDSPFTYSPTYMSEWLDFTDKTEVKRFETNEDFNTQDMFNLNITDNTLQLNKKHITFQRESEKFDEDFIRYEPNIPLYEDMSFSKGLFIEESTENIFYGYRDYDTNWDVNVGQILNVTFNRPDNFGGSRASWIQVQSETSEHAIFTRDMFTIPPNTAFSFRFWIKNNISQNITFRTLSGDIQKEINVLDGWTEVVYEGLSFEESKNINFLFQSEGDQLSFEIAYEQFELKSYLTSYVSREREPEFLHGELNGFNMEEGAIEFWYTPTKEKESDSNLVTVVGDSTDLNIWTRNETIYFNIGDLEGFLLGGINRDEEHFIKLSWSKSEDKVLFQCNDLMFTEDYNKINSNYHNTIFQSFYIGVDKYINKQSNGVFSNLIFYDIAKLTTNYQPIEKNIAEGMIYKATLNENLTVGTYGKARYFLNFTSDFNIVQNMCVINSNFNWNSSIGKNSSVQVYTYDQDNWKRYQENNRPIAGIYDGYDGYGKVIEFEVVFLSENTQEDTLLNEVEINIERGLLIRNLGDVELCPELWFSLEEKGDFSLINHANNDEEFKFILIERDEEVYVNNEHEIIETELEGVYRYDYFNDNYLELPVGLNYFTVDGKVKIRLRYEFKTLQG